MLFFTIRSCCWQCSNSTKNHFLSQEAWRRQILDEGERRGFATSIKVKKIYPARISAPKTSFVYHRTHPTYYVLLIDLDSYAGDDAAWSTVRRSLLDLVTLTIPSGSTLSVWTKEETEGGTRERMRRSMVTDANR